MEERHFKLLTSRFSQYIFSGQQTCRDLVPDDRYWRWRQVDQAGVPPGKWRGWSAYNNCHKGAVICSEVVTLFLIAGVSPGRNSALQAGQDYWHLSAAHRVSVQLLLNILYCVNNVLKNEDACHLQDLNLCNLLMWNCGKCVFHESVCMDSIIRMCSCSCSTK